MDYICPFCGKEIAADEVLFVHDFDSLYYQDDDRYNFLRGCSALYPFEADNTFKGKYFFATEENTVRRDANDFPKVLSVYPSEGLTPEELKYPYRNTANQAMDVEDFFATGQQPAPRYYEERVSLATRACPRCHCELPSEFGLLPVINLCLMGGRASGKTAYLIALIQQLNRQLSFNQLGSVSLLKESETYMSPQIEYYVTHDGVTRPTPTEDKLFPLVFHFSRKIFHNGPMQQNAAAQECYIAIYDMAGEGLGNPTYLLNHKGLSKSNIIMLMLDPNMLNNGGFWNAINTNYGSQMSYTHQEDLNASKQHDFYADPISSFLSHVVSVTTALHFDIQHVIGVVTKVDLPLRVDQKLFESDQVLLKSNTNDTHMGRVNVGALAQIERELLQYFNYKLGGTKDKPVSIKRMIENAFGTAMDSSLLAVSTYTRRPDDASHNIVFENLYYETASKHRIIEPFLKLLTLTNMVPTSEMSLPPQKQRPKNGWFGRR